MGERPIPPRVRPGLQVLARLTDSEYQRLLFALQEASPSSSPTRVKGECAQASGLATDDADAIVDAIFSTAAHRSHVGVPVEEFADSLDVSDLELSDDEKARVARRLAPLLSTEAITISLRAVELLFASQRYVTGSRIITDIRPVFPESIGIDGEPSEPSGAMVVHSLRIEYIEEGEERAFSVNLDGSDIAELREVVGRAENKARSLARVIERAGVRDLSESNTGVDGHEAE